MQDAVDMFFPPLLEDDDKPQRKQPVRFIEAVFAALIGAGLLGIFGLLMVGLLWIAELFR